MPIDDDDTFARTMTGIEKLRSRSHEDDWLQWRRVVVANVKAGEKLEERVGRLEGLQHHYARVTAQAAMTKRLEALERAAETRKSRAERILSALGKVAALIATALIARWLK